MQRSALLSLARATGRVCVEPQLSVRLQPTLDRWKDFSPFLRSFGLFAAAALPSLVVVFGIIIDYRYLTPLHACSRPPTIGHKRLELLRRSSLSLGVVVVVGVRERRVKSEGELDQSVQPPAPLVDGRPLLGWRLSPLGVVYRVAFGAFSAPASRWSLLLRALWAGRIEVLLGWSIAPPIDAQHAICTRKKNVVRVFGSKSEAKISGFLFFSQPELLANSTLGSPMKKVPKNLLVAGG